MISVCDPMGMPCWHVCEGVLGNAQEETLTWPSLAGTLALPHRLMLDRGLSMVAQCLSATISLLLTSVCFCFSGLLPP